MSKIIKCCLAFFLVFICTVSFSFAGDCDGVPDQDRIRDQDGSSQEYVVGHGTALLLAGNQDTDKSQEPKGPNQEQGQSQNKNGSGPIQEPEQDQDKNQG